MRHSLVFTLRARPVLLVGVSFPQFFVDARDSERGLILQLGGSSLLLRAKLLLHLLLLQLRVSLLRLASDPSQRHRSSLDQGLLVNDMLDQNLLLLLRGQLLKSHLLLRSELDLPSHLPIRQNDVHLLENLTLILLWLVLTLSKLYHLETAGKLIVRHR